jgi:HEAT repeat protein
MIICKKSVNLGFKRLMRLEDLNSTIIILFSLLIVCFISACNSEKMDGYIGQLKSPNDVVKKNAISELGKAQEIRAVPYLISLLDIGSSDILVASVDALGRIGDKRAVEGLIRLVDNKDDLVRKKAIESLGKIGDPRAVPILTELLRGKDSIDPISLEEKITPEEKITAIWALGAIGDEKAIPVLTGLINSEDKYIRYNAEQSLKKIDRYNHTIT